MTRKLLFFIIIFTFCIKGFSQDDPCTAIPIPLNPIGSCTYTIGDNTGATDSDLTNPNIDPPSGCDPVSAFYNGADVWFSTVVGPTGNIQIDVTHIASSNFNDAVAALYTGNCSGALSIVECDDDSGTDPLAANFSALGLTPGTTVYIRVWHWGGFNEGTFNICASEVINPCDSITPITECGTTPINATIAAGFGAFNDSACFDVPGDEVIYSFTPSITGNYTITQISTFDHINYLYQTSCEPAGWTCIGDLFGNNETSGSFSMVAGTTYYIMLDSENSNGGNVSFTLNCSPPPLTCGSTFTDSGGLSGDYSNNEFETTTITPTNAGDAVTVTFTVFDLESCCDELRIYDGPDATYPLLGIYAATTPPTFTSSDPSGALTFVFESDFSVTREGWAADITCSSACNLIITDTVYPLGADACSLDYTELTTNATSSTNNIIYSENFSATTFPPGWTIVNGASSANWIISNSNNAGGTAREAQLDWTTGGDITTWSLSSPLINITGNNNLQLSFKHDLWQFGTDFSIFIETSLDNTNWTVQYSVVNPPDITETRNVDLSSLDGNNNLYIRYRFTGDSFDLFSWSIDDIVVTADGAPTPPEITWSPATGLFTDTSLTTPYVLGDFAGTVYAAANSSETYIATDANGCTDTITITNNRKIWDGSTSDDWMEPLNWSDDAIPTAADCVVIPVTGNDPVIYTNDNGDGLNMAIYNGATLTVETGASVTIQDWIDLQGNSEIYLQDGGSLIQVNEDVIPNNNNTGSGTLRMDRTADVRLNDYVYWSSPVGDWSTPTAPLGSFNVSSIATTPSYRWVPTINQSTIPPANPPPNSDPFEFGEWQAYNGLMEVGKGYIVKSPIGSTDYLQPTSPFTHTFTGFPNNGRVLTPIERGDFTGVGYFYFGPGGESIDVSPSDDNWNLVGNPYPSAISADLFIQHNAAELQDAAGPPVVQGTVHLWTHGTDLSNTEDSPFYQEFEYNYTQNDYISYNSTGSNPPGFSGFIASGQGFFVEMDNATSTNSSFVEFTNSMRSLSTPGYTNSNFYRTASNDIEKHRIWLDLLDTNNQAKSILIGYVEGATQNVDRLFDGHFISVQGANFYSLADDSLLSIQGRSLPFYDTDTVPLGLKIPVEGNYTIAINSLDGLFEGDNGQNIYLEDTYVGLIHNLRMSPYSFNIEEGNYNDRFILRYTNDTLGLNELELGSGVTIIAPNSNYIKVNSNHSLIQNVIVYDLLGRVLFDRHSINQSEFILNDHNLSVGTYIVKATLINGQSKAQKIVLKN